MADSRAILPALRALVGRGMPSRQEREAENARAREMQRELLPRDVPQMQGFRIGAAWQPSEEVSGDYFEVFSLDGERMALCIADVAGRGTEAAALARELREAVRRLAPQAGSPADLCTQVNQALSGTIAPAKYITLFYAVLESTGRVEYENAGHCQPVLMRREGDVEFPASFSGVVGIFSHWLYRNQELEMRSGDSLILLTDGVLAAENGGGEEFGYRRLIAELEGRRGMDGQRLAGELMAAVSQFCAGRFRDDASMVAVTRE